MYRCTRRSNLPSLNLKRIKNCWGSGKRVSEAKELGVGGWVWSGERVRLRDFWGKFLGGVGNEKTCFRVWG